MLSPLSQKVEFTDERPATREESEQAVDPEIMEVGLQKERWLLPGMRKQTLFISLYHSVEFDQNGNLHTHSAGSFSFETN